MPMSDEFVKLREKAILLKQRIADLAAEKQMATLECSKIGKSISDMKADLKEREKDLVGYELIFYFKNGSKADISVSAEYQILSQRHQDMSVGISIFEKDLREKKAIAKKANEEKNLLETVDLRYAFSTAAIQSTVPIKTENFEGSQYGIVIKNYREDGSCTEKYVYLYLKDDIWYEKNEHSGKYETIKPNTHYDYIIKNYLSDK